MAPYLIVILAALSMLGAFSIDAYLPALPAIAEQFSATSHAVQLSLTAYVFAFAVMTLFHGTLSDSLGRRPIILVSLVCYLLATLGVAFSNSLEMLIGLRLLQGLSAGGGAVVARAIVADLLSGRRAHRAMSAINVVFGLAPAIAPILGGWLLFAFGWRSIFIAIAVFTVILLIACFFFLAESLPPEKRLPFHLRTVLGNYWTVGSHGYFVLRSASTALAFSGIMIYVSAAPNYVLNILGLTVTDFGWLFLPLVGGMIIGSFLAGWLSHRMKTPLVISLAFAIMLVSALANIATSLWLTPHLPWVVIPLITYSLGSALGTPAMSMISLEMFPRFRGMAASLQTFAFMMLFTIISGLIVPHLFDSPVKLAIGNAIGALLSVLCWMAASGCRKPEKISNHRLKVEPPGARQDPEGNAIDAG